MGGGDQERLQFEGVFGSLAWTMSKNCLTEMTVPEQYSLPEQTKKEKKRKEKRREEDDGGGGGGCDEEEEQRRQAVKSQRVYFNAQQGVVARND